MGAYYEMQYFCGDYYLIYQDSSTDWKEKSIKLSKEQVDSIDNFQAEQRESESKFLKLNIVMLAKQQ